MAQRSTDRVAGSVQATVVPIHIWIDGQVYQTTKWGLEGFLLAARTAACTPGRDLYCSLEIPFDGFAVKLEAKARLSDNQPEQDQARFEFVELDDRSQQVLTRFIAGLNDPADFGQEDFVCQLASQASGKPSATRGAKTFARFAGAGTLLSVSVIAAYLVLVAGNGETPAPMLESARIAASVQTIAASEGGFLQKIEVANGEFVRKGSTVALISQAPDPSRLTALERKIKALTLQIAADERELALQREKLGEQRKLIDGRISADERQIEKLRKRLDHARIRHAQINGLFKKGFSARVTVEKRKAAVLTLEDQIVAVEARLTENRLVRESLNSGLYYTRGEFVDLTRELESRIELRRAKVELAERERAEYQQRKISLPMIAPFDGYVTRILTPDGARVRRGDPIVALETSDPRRVETVLPIERNSHLRVGGAAFAVGPSAGERAELSVEKVAAHSPGPGQPSELRVMLSFKHLGPDAIRARFKIDAPVFIRFQRERDAALLSRAARWWKQIAAPDRHNLGPRAEKPLKQHKVGS